MVPHPEDHQVSRGRLSGGRSGNGGLEGDRAPLKDNISHIKAPVLSLLNHPLNRLDLV